MRAFVRETPYSLGHYSNFALTIEFILGDIIIASFLNTHSSSNSTVWPVTMKTTSQREEATLACLSDTFDEEVRSSGPYKSVYFIFFLRLAFYKVVYTWIRGVIWYINDLSFDSCFISRLFFPSSSISSALCLQFMWV